MTVLNSFVARGAFNITPDSGNDLTTKAYSIYVTGAGNLHYKGDDGVDHTIALSAGQIWPVVVKRVYADSTTTGIVGFKAF